MRISVFTGTATPVGELGADITHQAERLGQRIAEHGHTLIYGGGSRGLMYSSVKGALDHGGRVEAYIPADFNAYAPSPAAVKVNISTDIEQRRLDMVLNSDAFIALPGGIGTLEEIATVIKYRQLWDYSMEVAGAFDNKPLYLINYKGVYDALLSQIHTMVELGMVKPVYETYLSPVASVEDIPL